MNLSAISIRRPVFAWMLMLALILFGAIGFSRMGISHMPDVNFPVVSISLKLDNAAPEIMEMNVVDIIEDAVMGIDGVKNIASSISQGKAHITCEFAMSRDIDVVMQEVQNRLLQVANRLPEQLDPPVITKTNPEDQPIIWVMVTADDNVPLSRLMIYARNTLKNQLSTLDGVGNVTLAGYVEPNLRVWLDRDKLYQYELTSKDIQNAISNEQSEQPAGRLEAETSEMNVRVLGEAASPEAFSQIRINTRGGLANYNPIPLSRVSKIEEGTADVRAISRYNGKIAVGLGIVKQHGANAVAIAKSVRERVEQMRPTLMPGIHADVRLDSTKYISSSVRELNFALIFAAILTSVVCFLFLGSWSSTLNVLMAIPTSIVGAFMVLYFLGFTLNSFTLLGLSLAIGIVVDDAIMMLENIVRHREMGKSKLQAALDGSKEISFAALATTMAIGAIFIPVIFMKGVVGAFFYQYGITVTVAVFLSLLEALTLTPMRCARYLHSPHSQPTRLLQVMDAMMTRLSRGYRSSLGWALDHRLLVVSVSIALFASSLLFVSKLRKELVPAQDQGMFVLNLKTEIGTSIAATDQVFQKVEAHLRKQLEIKDLYTTIGNFQNNNVVNAGSIYVLLTDARERALSQSQVMAKTRRELKAAFPEVAVVTQDLSLTGFSASRGFPVEFTLEGPEWSKLKTYAEQIEKKLAATSLVEDFTSDYQDGMAQVQIIPDRNKTAERGISITAIAQEVNALIGGQVFGANTQYSLDGHRYSIRLRSVPEQRSAPEDIGRLKVRNNRGEILPLTSAAEIKTTTGPDVITRFGRQRAIPMYANVQEGKSQQAALQAVEQIAQEILPPGYAIRILGSGHAFHEAFDGLVFALILGVIIAYMILASQFNSFIHPVTILMALPFSLSGALFALWATNQSLSLFSMIGLVLLMGIVKKNSILLVDFTNQRRAEGLPLRKALEEACPVRLRPILMTSIAIIVGAIPEAVNFGAGSETRIPMAVSIIGGVTLSTLLTLYVVPCVYSLLARFERADVAESEAAS